MTALPIELVPGPTTMEPGVPAWTPLRIGLVLAWSAALVALLAVALGGWSLLDLAERRIRFVSAVTHELRTPLTTLRLYLDMLVNGMIRQPEQRMEYLTTLHAEAERLHRLVGNVLDFSRLEKRGWRPKRTDIAIASLAERLRSTWQGPCQQAGKQLVLDSRVSNDEVVRTDAALVEQIVGNLIDNACKYSRTAEDNRIWLRFYRRDSQLIIDVEDRGPGISRTDRGTIFRPFRRGCNTEATAGGVGLGLALAHQWAKLLGGSLTYHPVPTGACFRLVLK